MHRPDGTCVALLLMLSLTIGCGGESKSSPDATVPAKVPTEISSGVPAQAPDYVPAGVPASSRLPTRDGGNPVAYKYRVKLDSHCTAEQPDGRQTKIDADSTFTYVWRWRDTQAELLLDSLKVSTTIDGQPVMDSSMSGAHFRLQRGDQMVSETFQSASPQLKRVLEDCFRNPLCRMVVDRQGQEVQRTITAGPAAESVVNTGIITNTRLFHAPFPGGRQRWEAPGEMATGDGGYARGSVTYQTTGRPVAGGDEPSKLVEVKVSGTLASQQDSQKDSVDGNPVRNAVYHLEGTQVYNRRLKEWISGDLTVQVSFDAVSDGEKVSNSGTIRLAMELVDSQQLPPVRVAEEEGPALR